MSSYWIPAGVLALGAVSILMLIGTNWIRERLIERNAVLVESVREVQTLQAISHLWLEEYVTGDELHLDEFQSAQRRSVSIVTAMLDGGRLGAQNIVVPRIADVELRDKVAAIAGGLREFQAIARERYAGYRRGDDVGIGSAIDEQYDAVFETMLDKLGALEADLSEGLIRAHAQSRALFHTILATWSLLVALAVAGLYLRERRRAIAEAALRERDAQLHRAQKLEAVGRLAGGMAHDINNYLGAITAQCELVKLRPADAQRNVDRMDTVIATITKAATLIRRLLAFSRREIVQPEIVDINGAILDLQPMLARLIGEDIEFRLELTPHIPHVRMDPSSLEQMIVNLVVNAKEAMPTGGKLRVSTGRCVVSDDDPRAPSHLAGGDYVTLSVADQGCGIPADMLERIFEPFTTTKDAATSSGLGLATVDGIVRQSKGRITVDSTVGSGTTFRIYLPATGDVAAVRSPSVASPLPRGAGRILLVEDNDELRASMREAFEMLGYTVTCAPDGKTALSELERSSQGLDLVVTDVVMPEMNGKELVVAIRSAHPSVPVIFVSGYTDDVVLRHGISEREVHFVAKPYSIDQLMRKVQDVLRPEAT